MGFDIVRRRRNISKTNVQASYSTWPATRDLLESLTPEEIIEAANKVQQYKPNDDHHIKELLKMLSRIGSTMAGSDEKNRTCSHN